MPCPCTLYIYVDLRNELYDYLSEHVITFYLMSDIGKTVQILILQEGVPNSTKIY